MLINDREAQKRLASPDNLMNRLRNISTTDRGKATTRAMELFGIGNKVTPPVPVNPPLIQPIQTNSSVPQSASNSPSVDDLILNADSKLKLELAHTAALDTLVSSVSQLQKAIPSLESPVKLSQIAMNMSKIMTTLTEKKETNREDDKQVHYHFYMPEQAKIADYPVIEVNADSIV